MGFVKNTRAESFEAVESDEKIASLDDLDERREALREISRIGQIQARNEAETSEADRPA